MPVYPATLAARDRFVLERRTPRPARDPWRFQDLIVEDERTADGPVARVATLFLTGSECPWRCVMCDLWRNTVEFDTPEGAIAGQVAAARDALNQRRDIVTQLKLYNAGSFFDARAVPERDYDGVASALAGLARVVVESHPALVGRRVTQFLESLDRRTAGGAPQLEVAMGLETAHPDALERLNKRMTVDQFARAAESLKGWGVALRVFLLISPPFVPADEQRAWLRQSVDVAFCCGASVVSIIPTRPGNGAIEGLAEAGLFRPPTITDIEQSAEAALAEAGGRGRLFVDLWNLEQLARCRRCFSARRDRLHSMNIEQRVRPAVDCPECEARG